MDEERDEFVGGDHNQRMEVSKFFTFIFDYVQI